MFASQKQSALNLNFILYRLGFLACFDDNKMARKKEAEISQLLVWLSSMNATSRSRAIPIDELPGNLAKVVPAAENLGLVEIAENGVFLSADVLEGRTPRKLIAFLRKRIIFAGIASSFLVCMLILIIFSLLTPTIELSATALIIILILGVL